MISLDVVSDFVYQHCENVKVTKNGTHYLARCPLCGDSKKSLAKRRFNLDYNEGQPIFHCFNCGESGSFLQLYSHINGTTISEALKELKNYNPDYLIQRLSKRKKDKVIEEIEHEYHDYILQDCVFVRDSTDSLLKKQYINSLKRFIEDRNIRTDVFMAYKGKYQSRYIIPIYDKDGHIVYFQARASVNTMMPKYRNPTLAKGSIIYNEHKFDKNKYIVVCEGLLDGDAVGDQGTTCLGAEINKKFLERVGKLTDKGVIIALDNDKTGIESVLELIEGINLSKHTKFFLFPQKYKNCKDINEFSVTYNINKVYEFVVSNSFSPTNAYTKIYMDSWRKKIWKEGVD